MTTFVYILKCIDGAFYTGLTRGSLELRLAQHNEGTFKGFTFTRRPVELVFSQDFENLNQAIEAERQLKGWSRQKKIALIEGRFNDLPFLAQRRT